MADLSAFPVTAKWPPRHPDRLQYYGMPTPNGVKVSIMLEECGLPYEAHKVAFADHAQKSPEYRSLNPNGRIPAILDPVGPDGEPVAVWESGAILVYLADKAGRFLPAGGAARQAALAWVWWQVGGLGPIAGQLSFFARTGGKNGEDTRPRDRFADEVKRLLGVLDGRLAGRDWIADAYGIADIACIGWARTLRAADEGGLIGFGAFPNVAAWLERALARPAVQAGLKVPA